MVVHGRHSHEGGPDAKRRHRLIVTSKVAALSPTDLKSHALLRNPKGASLDRPGAARRARRPLAVIGGPDVYGLFLDIGYDEFHLSRVANVRIPGGRPVFPEIGPNRTPEDVLASHGLKPGAERVLDQAAGATLVGWWR